MTEPPEKPIFKMNWKGLLELPEITINVTGHLADAKPGENLQEETFMNEDKPLKERLSYSMANLVLSILLLISLLSIWHRIHQLEQEVSAHRAILIEIQEQNITEETP